MKRPYVIICAILGFIATIGLSVLLETYGTHLLFAHVVAPRIAEPIARVSAERIDPAQEGRLVYVQGELRAEEEAGAPPRLRLGAYTLQVEGMKDGWLPTVVNEPVEVVGRQRGHTLVPLAEDVEALMKLREALSTPVSAKEWALILAAFGLGIGLIALLFATLFGYAWYHYVAKGKGWPPMKRSLLIMSGLCFSLFMAVYIVISTCGSYNRHGAYALQEVYGIRLADAGCILNPDFFAICQRVISDAASYGWGILIALFLFSCIHSCIRRFRAKNNG